MQDKNKLFEKKQKGDVALVAKILDVKPANASRLLARKGAKRHKEAMDALRKVIELRESLIRSKNE